MLVEFRDFLAVVEAPVNEARSLAVIAEAAKLVPTKQIRYVVNTHHHFDHSGGLRTYLSQGTTIVTHESNKEYYLDILFDPRPWTLQPDRMSIFNPMYMISRRPAPIDTVGNKYAISDGTRVMEILHLQDMAYELGDPSYRQGNHGQDMLIAYLPKEKLLLNADLYSPPAQGAGADDAEQRREDAVPEHAQAEARRRAARAHPRPRRDQRRVPEDVPQELSS